MTSKFKENIRKIKRIHRMSGNYTMPKPIEDLVNSNLPTKLQMKQAKKEIRVYVWEAGANIHPNTALDEEIMAHCEATGEVYSLEFFEEQCNNQELDLSNKFIRII